MTPARHIFSAAAQATTRSMSGVKTSAATRTSAFRDGARRETNRHALAARCPLC
jgi:hypothetical protein